MGVESSVKSHELEVEEASEIQNALIGHLLPVLARSAAIRSSRFYNEFVALLLRDRLLLDNQRKKITL